MTIQVGHPHECPTFFLCPQGEVNESTGQRVNKLVSDRSDKSDSSDAAKCKSPLAPKICAICGIYKSQYQLDIITQTERTVPLVCAGRAQRRLRPCRFYGDLLRPRHRHLRFRAAAKVALPHCCRIEARGSREFRVLAVFRLFQ